MQYLISVSGRSFYIGGPLPIVFTLMPLAKIKLYQIHVFIEGAVDYYTLSLSQLLANVLFFWFCFFLQNGLIITAK